MSSIMRSTFALVSRCNSRFLRLRPGAVAGPSSYTLSAAAARPYSQGPIARPSPPPLPAEDQREFEELVRAAQAPLSRPSTRVEAEAELSMHPDARAPVEAEFVGEQNPITGEVGGPKREPVRSWRGDEGDWSFKGRVSDF